MINLLNVFTTLDKVDNELALQCLIFIAQKAKLTKDHYKFSFCNSVFALPFSTHLETDLIALEKEGFLLNTGTTETILLTEKGKGEPKGPSEDSPTTEKIKELSALSAERLSIIARVLYAKEIFKDLCENDEDKLKEKIKGYLSIERKEIDEVFGILESLGGELI